jgi:DNA-binding transcriptional regulator LsrR (DeoR family)
MREETDQTFEDALKVARMYYHLNLTTAEIGAQLGVPRPTVSRLLSWAKAHGIVEFRILDHRRYQLELETSLEKKFGIAEVKVVPLGPDATDAERREAVTRFAAHYLSSILGPNMSLSVAWGATVSELARRLIPKPLPGMDVVQMNGSGNSGSGITYAADIISAFAANYQARAHLLPIPAYFDNPDTKAGMFRERYIKRVNDIAERADVALFSIGVPDANSYIYQAGYLEKSELDRLLTDKVVGDIATVFFRADGGYEDVAMNRRSSGPALSSLSGHRHAICVVASEKKREGILGALRGGYMNTLIIDEPTARTL